MISLSLSLLFVVIGHRDLVVSGIAVNSARQLLEKPEWLHTCKRDLPNENECFRKLFEGCFPALTDGIPEAGIVSFEPLLLKSVQLQKGSGNLVLSGGFHDLVVKGPSNATVKKANLDLHNNNLTFDIDLPLLKIRAKYNLKGQILLLPLVGNGDVNMALKNVQTSVTTKISLKNIPEETIHIDDMKVSFNVGGMRIHLTNLFNGNEILGASINTFLNQNSDEIIKELRPDLERGLADTFKTLWNDVFSKIPTKLWLL